MRKGRSYRSLYLPAWTIVAAVLTLLLVVAFSTYRNMSRERGRMEESLLREGQVIIRAIEASVRADFPPAPPDARRLQKLVEEVTREQEVDAIVIFDREGKMVATSRPADAVPEKVKGVASLQVLIGERGIVTSYRAQPDGRQTFELIQPFRPYAYQTPRPLRREPGGKPAPQEEPLRRWAEDKMIALSLHLAAFETARREDRHHNLLMAAILVALGTGALYFIFIVQNYYLVDRSLDRMKSYTENLVESMADGVLSIDREGRIVTLNRQAGQILDDGRGPLEGTRISSVLGEDVGGMLASMGEDRPIRDRKIDILRKNGGGDGRMPLSLSAAPLRDEKGGEMGSVLLIRDLREIRDLQDKVRRSERLASLGRLAAGVAHEIRNPLSSIRGFAQYFAKRFSGNDQEQGYALVMVKEVDRLNRVITDLLDFAGSREPRREPQRLEAIADQALKLLAPDLEARGVSVVTDFEPGLPEVPVDRDRISQVFLNLLLNAIESMEGGGEIRIGLRRCGPPAGIEASFADTGGGISEGDLEQVFEPFFSRKKKGTGLGLAIVHQIIERHRGDIRVESRPGSGTTFRIRLPLEEKAVV